MTDITFDKTTKHNVTLLDSVYAAAKLSAEKRGLTANELIQNLLIDFTIEDGTLNKDAEARIKLGRSLVAQAVATAEELCRNGGPAQTITLDTFHACANDTKWAEGYATYIGDNIYKHGNPRKGSINREIGFRIRAAIDGVPEVGADGKPIVAKVTGEVIQSYTPMASYDVARFR